MSSRIVVLRGKTQGALNRVIISVIESCKTTGLDVTEYDLVKDPEGSGVIQDLQRGSVLCCFSFHGIGMYLRHEGSSAYPHFRVPLVTALGSHPLHAHASVRSATAFSAFLVASESHQADARTMMTAPHVSLVTPLAKVHSRHTPSPWEKRPIQLQFLGTGDFRAPSLLQQLDVPISLKRILTRAVDRTLETSATAWQAARQEFVEAGFHLPSIPPEDLAKWAREIDTFARAERTRRLVRGIQRFPLVLQGPRWSDTVGKQGNVTLVNNGAQDAALAMNETQVALHLSPCPEFAVHDRMLTAMAQRTTVLAAHTPALTRVFGDSNAIRMFTLPTANTLPGSLDDWLFDLFTNRASLEATAEAGFGWNNAIPDDYFGSKIVEAVKAFWAHRSLWGPEETGS